MTKRTVLILLFISLAFNLAVLGSILWLRFSRTCPAGALQSGHPRIDLPPHLQDAHVMWSPEIRTMHSHFNESKIELMRELAKDPIDETNITAIIDNSLNAQGTLEHALAQRLLDIRKQMTAAEAEEYFSSRAQQMNRRTQAFRQQYNRRQKDEKNNRN